MEEILHQIVDPSSYYGKVRYKSYAINKNPFLSCTGIYYTTENLNQPVQLRRW